MESAYLNEMPPCINERVARRPTGYVSTAPSAILVGETDICILGEFY